MHSDADSIKKSIRSYLMIGAALYVFTVITVAVNQIHLAVPFAITLALIIAIIKGSMVAAVFMHLNHEKRWIYGSLILTVVFFVVLMLRADLHDHGPHRHDVSDRDGAVACRRTGRCSQDTEMSLKAFHLLFIGLSAILAAFFAAWSIGQYQVAHELSYVAACALGVATAGTLVVYGAAFQRKPGGCSRCVTPSLTAVLLAIARPALACPVCFGQSDSPLANAMNLGILVMLGVVVAVLAGFASFIVYLNRRAARLAAQETVAAGRVCAPGHRTSRGNRVMLNLLGLPPQASTHAGDIDQMISLTHWLMVVLFVGWGAFFVYVLARFRQKANPVGRLRRRPRQAVEGARDPHRRRRNGPARLLRHSGVGHARPRLAGRQRSDRGPRRRRAVCLERSLSGSRRQVRPDRDRTRRG